MEDDYEDGQALGLEFQIRDDTKFKGDLSNNNHKLASLYDLMPSGDTNPNPVGEWNELRIVSKDKNVEHWLNGEMVLSYERGGTRFKEGIATSKFKKYENFGEAKSGHIMLQDHQDEVSYRNIRIRKI